MSSLLVITLLSVAEVTAPWVSDDGWIAVQPPIAPDFQQVEPGELDLVRWESQERGMTLWIERVEMGGNFSLEEVKVAVEEQYRTEGSIEIIDSVIFERGPLRIYRVTGHGAGTDGVREAFAQENAALDGKLYKATANGYNGEVLEDDAATAFLESFRAAAPDSIVYDDLQTRPPDFVDHLRVWSQRAGGAIFIIGLGIALATATRSMRKRPPAA